MSETFRTIRNKLGLEDLVEETGNQNRSGKETLVTKIDGSNLNAGDATNPDDTILDRINSFRSDIDTNITDITTNNTRITALNTLFNVINTNIQQNAVAISTNTTNIAGIGRAHMFRNSPSNSNDELILTNSGNPAPREFTTNSLGTNGGTRIIITANGRYMISANIIASLVSGSSSLRCWLNNSSIIGATNASTGIGNMRLLPFVVDLTANDYITFQIQNAGANGNNLGNQVMIMRIS